MTMEQAVASRPEPMLASIDLREYLQIKSRADTAEGALRDIITGCNMMLEVERSPAMRGFINEVKRVAQGGLL
jgi:hypothetical protein